jgi:hypothetical protein
MGTQFSPRIRVVKSGDIITVMLSQTYVPHGRGGCPICGHALNNAKTAKRWRIAGQVSLRELKKEEKLVG